MTKKVLVTGSSRGIGREIALTLAKDDFDVVLHFSKNSEAAKNVQEEIKNLGKSCDILQFDISNREQCKKVLERYISENGSFYGVVLNAGINKDNVFPAMEDFEWDDVKTDNYADDSITSERQNYYNDVGFGHYGQSWSDKLFRIKSGYYRGNKISCS